MILNALSARDSHPRGSGDTEVNRLIEAQPAPDPEDTARFNAEYRAQLFRWAAEQVRGEPLDHRADLFSLGGVLWVTAVAFAPDGRHGRPRATPRPISPRPDGVPAA